MKYFQKQLFSLIGISLLFFTSNSFASPPMKGLGEESKLKCPCWEGVHKSTLISAFDKFYGSGPLRGLFCSKSEVIPGSCGILESKGILPTYSYIAVCKPPMRSSLVPIIFLSPDGAWLCSGPSVQGFVILRDDLIPLCIDEAKAELKDTTGLCANPSEPANSP